MVRTPPDWLSMPPPVPYPPPPSPRPVPPGALAADHFSPFACQRSAGTITPVPAHRCSAGSAFGARSAVGLVGSETHGRAGEQRRAVIGEAPAIAPAAPAA